MNKIHDIKLSYDSNKQTHSLKRIVAYYYDTYVELNEKFEKMTEDEYTKIMIAKGERAKSLKEKEKIAEEYSENMKKYYPFIKPYSTLSFINRVNTLNGYIKFKSETIEEQFELPLIDFISYNLNNINEYIICFINYFDLVMDKLDKADLDKIKLNTLYEIKYISELAKKYYDKVIGDLLKKQKIFKECINFVYRIKLDKNTKDIIKNLTNEQRFFIYNQINDNPFTEFSHKFKSIDTLNYTYNNISYKRIKTITSLIEQIDPYGKELSHTYQYETNNLYTAFYITLYNIIAIKKWNAKICGNCERYFLTQKETVSYCNRILIDNMTCKEYGNMNYQRKKLELDTTYRKYRTIGTRLKTRCIPRKKGQKNIDPKFIKDLEEYRTVGKKMYRDCKKGLISPEEFKKWVAEQDKK